MSYAGGGRPTVVALTGTKQQIQTGKCMLTAVRGFGPSTGVHYIQIFDAVAADVTVGTTTPTWVVAGEDGVPTLGDGLPTHGLEIQNGIVAVSTTTPEGSTGNNQNAAFAIGG